MDKARAEAKRAGEKRYQGPPCSYGHDGERYVSNGACVQCVKDKAVQQRAKKKTMSEPEVSALLLRGGPNSREMAEAAGLGWYNSPSGDTDCGHMIIGLSGFCPLCGRSTPEPVNAKQPLDLAERLLS